MNTILSKSSKKPKIKGTGLPKSKTGIATVIAIDGPAGAGKSTVAKELARRLGFTYLDTGAMYRALTLKALRQKFNLEDEKAMIELACKTSVELKTNKQQEVRIFLDKEDVSEAIRSHEVTNNTFYIARVPGVRALMVERQREIGQKTNVVVEGRDIGTVVFPHAAKKFYLDADFKERAERRIKELKEKGKKFDEGALRQELQERDTRDLTRAIGPLKKAEDAVLIDSTYLNAEGVVAKILGLINKDG